MPDKCTVTIKIQGWLDENLAEGFAQSIVGKLNQQVPDTLLITYRLDLMKPMEGEVEQA